MMEKSNFTVVSGNEEHGKFSASEPRRAAMKAVNKYHKIGDSGVIAIRKLGTKKIREYQFEVTPYEAPEGAPDWLPKVSKKAVVQYMRTYTKAEQ